MNTTTRLDREHIEANLGDVCKHHGWKAQFGHPSGRIGRLVGHLMAWKNARMNRLAVRLLDIQPGDRVLEIGFGHGAAIRDTARLATKGLVCGIDVSDVMVAQATARNRKAIRKGRVELRQGSVSGFPYPDTQFDKVYAVNSIQHWPSIPDDLREVRRVMKPGALLLVCLRMKHPNQHGLMSPGFTPEGAARIVNRVREAGFGEVRTEVHQAGRETACVFGTA